MEFVKNPIGKIITEAFTENSPDSEKFDTFGTPKNLVIETMKVKKFDTFGDNKKFETFGGNSGLQDPPTKLSSINKKVPTEQEEIIAPIEEKISRKVRSRGNSSKKVSRKNSADQKRSKNSSSEKKVLSKRISITDVDDRLKNLRQNIKKDIDQKITHKDSEQRLSESSRTSDNILFDRAERDLLVVEKNTSGL